MYSDYFLITFRLLVYHLDLNEDYCVPYSVFVTFFINNLKSIKHYIMSRFPELGLMKE